MQKQQNWIWVKSQLRAHQQRKHSLPALLFVCNDLLNPILVMSYKSINLVLFSKAPLLMGSEGSGQGVCSPWILKFNIFLSNFL